MSNQSCRDNNSGIDGMHSRLSKILSEAEKRRDCVIRGTPDGWGEVRSLRNFLTCVLDAEVKTVRPLAESLAYDPGDAMARQAAEELRLLMGERERIEILLSGISAV